MQLKKILVLLPDGIGLRNFVFSDFCDLAKSRGFEVTFWNATDFDFSVLKIPQIDISKQQTHPLTDIIKAVKNRAELQYNKRGSGDAIYDSYLFRSKVTSFSGFLKFLISKWYLLTNPGQKGLGRLRRKLLHYEGTTDYFQRCLSELRAQTPDIVFCTNHRISRAIAPLLAAQNLGIPTATFIFSWDNLPKGSLVVEPDFYFVWSHHMRQELLSYYPHISDNQVYVTGTPQFSPHYNESLLLSRTDFFNQHGLDEGRKYVCYSGDDITTSPFDQNYLSDVANAIIRLNNQGHNLGIIFRRCPVDFSDRYDSVLEKYRHVITSISPAWTAKSEAWNTILPTKQDIALQMSTIFHTELVINLSSSMVFDYAAFGKPCAYLRYNNAGQKGVKSVETIYNYIHFRSMPADAVMWLNNREEIADKIEMLLNESTEIVKQANAWFQNMVSQPSHLANDRILDAISAIIKKPADA